MPNFNSAIIKLNAWCNLDCTYCYMFNLGDETYKSVPREIPYDVWDLICERIGEQVESTSGVFNVVLHGGEPSLLPDAKFEYILRSLRDRCGKRVRVSVQTNGYVVRRSFLDICSKYGISIGVSLDGPKEHNDKFRINHGGRGSYDKVIATVNRMLAEGYDHLFAGFLSVANPDVDPETYWDWIRKLPRQNVNLLWPIEFNHMTPSTEPGRYGHWLLRLFELWLEADDPNIRIPLFFDVVKIAMGGRSHKDQIVNDTMDMFVINTDGRYEYPDYFRPKGEEFVSSGHDVQTTSLAELSRDDTFDALFSLDEQLPKACEGCSVQKLCGGGFLANRLSDGTTLRDDLNTRSAMCEDHFIFYRGALEALNAQAVRAEAI